MKERIVAEVSKNWVGGSTESVGISRSFETVIRKNAERGFELESWQYHAVCPMPQFINETIIAVFVREETSHPLAPTPSPGTHQD